MNYKALFAVTAAVLMALAAVAVVSGSTEADSETGISNVSYFEENDKIFMTEILFMGNVNLFVNSVRL